MRFRHKLNELRYAVQNKYNRPASRQIALGEEEKNAIEHYIKNLRENIGRLVILSNFNFIRSTTQSQRYGTMDS